MANASTVLRKIHNYGKKVLPLAEWEDAISRRLFKLLHRGFSTTINYIPPSSLLIIIVDNYTQITSYVELIVDRYKNDSVILNIVDQDKHVDYSVDISALHPPIYRTEVITTIDLNSRSLNWFTFDIANLIINKVPLPNQMLQLTTPDTSRSSLLPRVEYEKDLAYSPPPMVLGHIARSDTVTRVL